MNEQSAAPGAVAIHPHPQPVSFALAVPGSKSLANRAILLAAVADGTSRLAGISDSDDVRAALGAVRGLGAGVRRLPSGELEIVGHGPDFAVKTGDIDIRSSGTVGRFLPGLLAAAPSGDWRLVATPQLAKRPLDPLLGALRTWGAAIQPAVPGQSFPLAVEGTGLSGGRVEVSASASSQFASGVLMAAPLANHPAEVVVRDLDPEEVYVEMTLDLMRSFGVRATVSKAGGMVAVGVDAPQAYHPADMAIEADFNSALYFLCLPLLLGGAATVTNLSDASRQPGRKFLAILARMGGGVAAGPSGITVSGSNRPLRGGFSVDMRAMSEMVLTLGVLSAFADAPVTMTNIGHIRGHEVDRIAALAKLLDAVGVVSDQGDDWLRVHPAPAGGPRHAVIDSLDDHRVVMSFALLALAGNGLTITNPRAVNKTFPSFLPLLSQTGARLEQISGGENGA